LETALKATSALYDQSAESLMDLTAEDISKIFEGAKVCDLLLQPGTTILDLAMQAGCFASESKYNDMAYRMLRNSGLLWILLPVVPLRCPGLLQLHGVMSDVTSNSTL
jgi:hypothetical protein